MYNSRYKIRCFVIYLVWVGFPVPYVGFLSLQGSFFPMASPIVIPNYEEEKVLSLKKLEKVSFTSGSYPTFQCPLVTR